MSRNLWGQSCIYRRDIFVSTLVIQKSACYTIGLAKELNTFFQALIPYSSFNNVVKIRCQWRWRVPLKYCSVLSITHYLFFGSRKHSLMKICRKHNVKIQVYQCQRHVIWYVLIFYYVIYMKTDMWSAYQNSFRTVCYPKLSSHIWYKVNKLASCTVIGLWLSYFP